METPQHSVKPSQCKAIILISLLEINLRRAGI